MIRWLPALAAASGCAAAAIRWTQVMTARRDTLQTWTRVLTRMEANLTLYDDMPSLLRAAATGETDGEVRRALLACAETMEKEPSQTLEAAMRGIKMHRLCVWRIGARSNRSGERWDSAGVKKAALCCRLHNGR